MLISGSLRCSGDEIRAAGQQAGRLAASRQADAQRHTRVATGCHAVATATYTMTLIGPRVCPAQGRRTYFFRRSNVSCNTLERLIRVVARCRCPLWTSAPVSEETAGVEHDDLAFGPVLDDPLAPKRCQGLDHLRPGGERHPREDVLRERQDDLPVG